MAKLIIDRFEGKIAIVELADKSIASMPKSVLPPQAKEGDVIRIEVDTVETSKRKTTARDLMEGLLKK